ncbi:MAG: fumarylacetoacetate hydrolase family protein [Oscillospiraceae bacterium]|nr:fumarylacetoacetate hydrolase family protein [Oscillospiraceae bacterium]
MKYVRILRDGLPCWGVVEGDRVRTLREAPYESVVYDGGAEKLAECTLLPPCTPSKIVCVGKNYYDHAVEMNEGIPEHPILFLKGPNTLNRHEGAVHAPSFVQRLDYEGELAFVIRKRAKDVLAADWREYILGCTCLNDVTARDVQKGDVQWTRGKSMDGFAPVGPWVTDEVDPADLKLETRLNEQVVQSGRTSQFMTSVPNMLAFITAAMTLEPGDVVSTGTPAGIGPMKPGDVVEVEIEGIGVLRSYIK